MEIGFLPLLKTEVILFPGVLQSKVTLLNVENGELLNKIMNTDLADITFGKIESIYS